MTSQSARPASGSITFRTREIDREARRRAHRGDYRHAGRSGLLQQFKARPSAQQQHASGKRQGALEKPGADEFVERIVSADIFAGRQEISSLVEEARGMQSAGITEDILRSAGPHDERTQQLRRHLDRAADRPDWQHLLHGLERCLAAYAATGTRIKVSLEARKVQRNVGRQLHAHDIAGRTANAGRCNVIFWNG